MKEVEISQLLSLELAGASAEVNDDGIKDDNTVSPSASSLDDAKTSFRDALGLNEHQEDKENLPFFPAIVGHRGALYAELENTVPAFTQCATWGCEGVELDVFTLKDGNVVVFHGSGHDEDPGYLTGYCINQDGVNLLDLTYEETQKLQFNPQFAEFPCPTDKIFAGRIPLLSEVLNTLKGTGVEIKIEIKGEDTILPVLQIVEALDMTNQCSYSCFDHRKLLELRTLRPDKIKYPTGALFNKPLPKDFIAKAQACGATEVHLRYDTCTVENVRAIREAGLRSMAWLRGPVGMASDCATVYKDIGEQEGESCYQALWETGVDQICCNRPDVALRLKPQVPQ